MENYLIIKSIIMFVALVTAFGYFFIKVKRLYQIMMSVDGTVEKPIDRIGERIKVLFTDVLGQSNVRRKLMPGLSHSLIFFGFLAIQVHSLELMIRGVFPSFDLLTFTPFIYSIYLFVADLLAFFVLVGFAYALYRRTIIKPDYLTMGRDANLIILFTCVIILSFHFINAFQTLLPVDTGAVSYKDIFPISGLLVSLLGLSRPFPWPGDIWV